MKLKTGTKRMLNPKNNIQIIITALIIIVVMEVKVGAQEILIDLKKSQKPTSAVNINIKDGTAARMNSDLVKLITLEGVTSGDSIKSMSTVEDSFARYFLGGDDKFAQSNIPAAYSDYGKAASALQGNDFNALLLAYKLANIGFFTLSDEVMNKISDKEFYKKQTDSIRSIFFPKSELTYDEEIELASFYADIYYNNLTKETARELTRKNTILKKSDWANYILAQAYFEAREYSRALGAINRALNMKRNSPFYLLYKSKILCEAKNYKEAVKTIERISNSGFLTEKFKKGLEVQKEFILANSLKNTSKSKYHLAKYFYLTGEYGRATKEAQTAVATGKRNYEAENLLAQIYMETSEYAKAKEVAKKSINMFKKNTDAYRILGDIAYYSGTYEEALTNYNMAIKYDRNNLHAQIKKAEILNKKGESEAAKAIATSLGVKYNDNADLYYLMSELYAEEEVKYLRKSLSINPFNSIAWLMLAEINITQSNYEEAEKYLVSVKITNKEDYRYYYTEGLLRKYRGDYYEAARCFKKSLKLNPNFTSAQIELNTLNL